MAKMTPEQWVTVLSQLGVAGVAMFVIVKVIVPMFIAKTAELVAAITAATKATDGNTAAVAALSERVARLEGIFDHRTGQPRHTPRMPQVESSRDLASDIDQPGNPRRR